MTIKKLFDPSKSINRSIEKVITYGVSQEARLKSEISEYVVTDSIDQQFENLLLKMEAAMDIGGENEVGVWVSGFYGSGKSSFTKYLGLAFDDRITIDGLEARVVRRPDGTLSIDDLLGRPAAGTPTGTPTGTPAATSWSTSSRNRGG